MSFKSITSKPKIVPKNIEKTESCKVNPTAGKNLGANFKATSKNEII
ncbi:hypothetical protein F3D3_1039 [Fusibacter sp. 3D3]|nr:hypothetical protein F3D3_1039 [Fusibacter sp. 3D3]